MLILSISSQKLLLIVFALLLWGIPALIIRFVFKKYQNQTEELQQLRREVKELRTKVRLEKIT